MNPGPMTKAQEEKLESVFNTVQRLETSNNNLLESVNKILQIHRSLQNDLQALTKRVEELESKSQAIASPGASTSFQPDISKMQEKIDDLENRSGRSNVLFTVLAIRTNLKHGTSPSVSPVNFALTNLAYPYPP